jgi:hypothetical protein
VVGRGGTLSATKSSNLRRGCVVLGDGVPSNASRQERVWRKRFAKAGVAAKYVGWLRVKLPLCTRARKLMCKRDRLGLELVCAP